MSITKLCEKMRSRLENEQVLQHAIVVQQPDLTTLLDEIDRLRAGLRAIADGNDGVCVSLMSHPPKCSRQERARALLEDAR